MYIPLDKWKLLVKSPAIEGKRGGRIITFSNVKRYFDNTAFFALVTNSWIGSTRAQSIVLEAAIRQTLESGRAAIIAVKQVRSSGSGEDEVGDESDVDDLIFS